MNPIFMFRSIETSSRTSEKHHASLDDQILDSLLLDKTNLTRHTYRTSRMPFSSTVHIKLRQKLRKTFENKCASSVYQVSTFVIGSFFILGVCDWFKQNTTFFKNSVSKTEGQRTLSLVAYKIIMKSSK